MTSEHRRDAVRAAIRADFADSRWPSRLALVAMLFWIAYEWGVGNEMLTPWILVQVISASNGWASIPATAVVGFVFTAVQQAISGLTALAGLSMFDRTANALWTTLRTRYQNVPGEWSQLNLPHRSLLVFTLGTTAIALIQTMATGKTGVRRHLSIILRSAVLCGVLVGALGAAAAALAEIGHRVQFLSTPTDWTLRVLGNPLFWLGLLAIVLLNRVIRSRRIERSTPAPSTTP
jgi:hypothetical protein